jgi:segregation and condensation protein A
MKIAGISPYWSAVLRDSGSNQSGTDALDSEEVNLSDKIRFIDRFASKNKRFSFKKLLEEQCDKIEIIVTFLGILELIKMGRIHVVQEEIFEDIMIDYNENNGELDDLDDLSFA